MARIAAKNHRNGVGNPCAHLQADLGCDFCRIAGDRKPMVAPPLRRTGCSPVSDGAAALVLTMAAAAPRGPAVAIRALAQANDFLNAKRHPIGATGVSRNVMAALQFTATAGAMQLPGAALAGVFDMGGLAVANYANVLERVR